MSVLQKVKVNDVDVPEGVTKYDLYKVSRDGSVRLLSFPPAASNRLFEDGGSQSTSACVTSHAGVCLTSIAAATPCGRGHKAALWLCHGCPHERKCSPRVTIKLLQNGERTRACTFPT